MEQATARSHSKKEDRRGAHLKIFVIENALLNYPFESTYDFHHLPDSRPDMDFQNGDL